MTFDVQRMRIWGVSSVISCLHDSVAVLLLFYRYGFMPVANCV